MRKVRVQGSNLYVFEKRDNEYTPLGAAVDCLFSAEVKKVEICAVKGASKRYRAGKAIWCIETGGLSAYGKKLFLAVGQPICVAFSVLKKDIVENGATIPDAIQDTSVMIIGDAIIDSCEHSAGLGGAATYKLRMQGVGKPTLYVNDGLGFPYTLPLIFA